MYKIKKEHEYTKCKYGRPLGWRDHSADHSVVLTMSPEKSCFVVDLSVSFRPGYKFCVSEFHQKGMKSSRGEKVFFVLVSSFTSEWKIDGGKQFMITEGTEKVCLLHFRLEDLSKYVTDCI